MSEVKFVKLANGEEFVAVVEETDTGIVVENPVVVSQRINEKTEQLESALVPWCGFVKNRTIVIDEENIMFVAEPTENLVGVYSNQFSVIIKPPTPKLLTA